MRRDQRLRDDRLCPDRGATLGHRSRRRRASCPTNARCRSGPRGSAPSCRRPHLDDRHLGVLFRREGGGLEFRHILDLAQPRPDESALLPHRVCARLGLVNLRAAIGLGRQSHDVAVNIHLPAMIKDSAARIPRRGSRPTGLYDGSTVRRACPAVPCYRGTRHSFQPGPRRAAGTLGRPVQTMSLHRTSCQTLT